MSSLTLRRASAVPTTPVRPGPRSDTPAGDTPPHFYIHASVEVREAMRPASKGLVLGVGHEQLAKVWTSVQNPDRFG